MTTESQHSKLSPTQVIKFIALLVVAVLLLVLSFGKLNVRLVIAQISNAQFSWVFLSFLCSALALMSRAIRWNILLESLSYKPKLRKTFYAVSIGYLANLAFPRFGEVTRCGSLTKSESIPFNVLIGTVIVERLIDVISLLICIAISITIEFKKLGNFIHENIFRPLFSNFQVLWSSSLMITLTTVFFIVAILILAYCIRRYRLPKTNVPFNLVKGVVDGIKSIAKLRRPGLFIFHSVLIWFLYYLSVYVALPSLPATRELGFSAALFLLVAGGLGMAAPVQGGIGAYHLLVSQGLVLYGLTNVEGLAFATLLHSLQLLLVFLFGGTSVFFLFLDNRRHQKVSQYKFHKR